MPRLFLFTGMTPSQRLFESQLAAIPGSSVVPWLAPQRGEQLGEYARRMADSLAIDEPCFVGGVSFGGMVALEVACLIRARGCFLISSIRSPAELPPWLRCWRLLGNLNADFLLAKVGSAAATMPRFCRTRSTARLGKLAHEQGAWHRWATSAVLRWQPKPDIAGIRVLRMHGAADRTFPLRYLSAGVDEIVPGGGHVLPLTHSQQVTKFLLQGMEQSPLTPSETP